MSVRIIIGDCRAALRSEPSGSVHCCVTSPPYFGLRDYGVAGQIGLEPTPEEFVAEMVALFREVRRVLRDDGTLWLNLGDSYANDGKWGGSTGGKHVSALHGESGIGRRKLNTGLKPKDLMGIPWMVAFALRADGWYLRQDIIWHKPNPMPESCTDRCTKGHEYFFLLSKSERYFYDSEAIKEPAERPEGSGNHAPYEVDGQRPGDNANIGGSLHKIGARDTRNKRSVWTVATQAFSEAHFATFPPALIEPSIMAGTSERGCCPRCGAGWQRVTINVETGKTHKMPDGMATYAGGHSAIHKDGREKGAADNPVLARETIGWYPMCDHDQLPKLPAYPDKPSRAVLGNEAAYKAALLTWREACRGVDAERRKLCERAAALPTKPAVVLDPFGGAGTTGLVADRLRRNAILIELNPEYAAMAARRIDGEAGMLSDVRTETLNPEASPA